MPEAQEVYKVVSAGEGGRYFSAWVPRSNELSREYFTTKYISAETGLLFAFKDYKIAEDWAWTLGISSHIEVWLARAHGVSTPPKLIPAIVNAYWRKKSFLADFWALVREVEVPSSWLPHSQASIDGSILCARIKLVKKMEGRKEE